MKPVREAKARSRAVVPLKKKKKKKKNSKYMGNANERLKISGSKCTIL
jgi:hypothetical protein